MNEISVRLLLDAQLFFAALRVLATPAEPLNASIPLSLPLRATVTGAESLAFPVEDITPYHARRGHERLTVGAGLLRSDFHLYGLFMYVKGWLDEEVHRSLDHELFLRLLCNILAELCDEE